MAEAGVLEPEIGAPPPDLENGSDSAAAKSGEKNKAGRPSNASRFRSSQDFAQMLAELTDADWQHHMVYVWRTDPIFDNTNGGVDKKYIAKFTSAVDEESLKQTFGSGTYKVQLNKYVGPNKDQYIAHTLWTIGPDMKFPPVLPPGDWLNHPRNRAWTSWRPLIEKRWHEAVAREIQTTAPAAPSGEVEALTKLIQKLVERETGKPAQSSDNDKLTATLVNWALAQTAETRKVEREGDSPSKIVDMMGAMIKAMKELAPAPPPPVEKEKGIDPTLTLILNNLRDDLKAARDEAKTERENNRKLMEKILDQKGEQANPLAQLETLGSVILKFGELTGKVSGGPRDWKDGLVDAVSDSLPKIVDLGSAYLTQKQIADRQRAAQAAAQPARPGAPAAPTSPPALPAPAATTTAPNGATTTAAPDPAATTAAPQPEQPPQTEMDVAERTQIVYVAVLAAQALNLAMKGDQFAEHVCIKHGDQAFEDFVKHFPKEGLIERFKAVPEAWAALSEHEPRLAEFIDAFYSFAEAEDDDEPEPAPAPKKAAGKPAAKGKKK